MSMDTPGTIFDAMVFLQALANDQGPAFACQRLVDEGKLKLFVSPAILEEVKDIANRPRLQRKFKNLTPENVEACLEDVRGIAVLITDVPHVFSYARDPDDEPYINLAIAVGAKYLVSRDNDLLDLDVRRGLPSTLPWPYHPESGGFVAGFLSQARGSILRGNAQLKEEKSSRQAWPNSVQSA